MSHLLFVDDKLLFCDDFRMEALKLKEILDLYCTAKEMNINIGKSIISLIGVSEDDIKKFPKCFAYQQVDFQRGLNYPELFVKQN